MKKALIFIVTLGFVLTLSACTSAEIDNLEDLLNNEALTSRESIATLAYLSGSLIDLDTTEPVVGIVPTLLSDTDTEETEVEGELDIVNEYMDRLKELMDNGTDSFGNAVEALSDNPLYALMITFTVNEELYTIYYNVDPVTFEISGMLLIGDVEYVIEVANTLSDNDDLDDDSSDDLDDDSSDDLDDDSSDDLDDDSSDDLDDDSSDDLDDDSSDDLDDENHNEEVEQKMVLTAYNGDNYVQVTYKVETDDEEIETKFTLVSFIDGVEKEVFMKISVEEDEYKITIEEEDNEFTFKRETEDGETTYKLKYKVNEVEGEIKIIVTVNELGETVYTYKIEEDGKSVDIEKDEPDHHSDDDDEDENEDEEEVEVEEEIETEIDGI